MTSTGTLSKLFIFAAGAAIGSVVTWQILEKKIEAKYEELVQEEIESVREHLGKRDVVSVEDDVVEDIDEDEELSVREYATRLSKQGYTNYTDVTKDNNKEVESLQKPYVIEPERFGEIDDYDVISFTYYADGVLTDDADDPISDKDIDDIIGKESLTHFGQYEDDSVFVRNDERKSDYEILFDSRNYEDIKDPTHPPRMEE